MKIILSLAIFAGTLFIESGIPVDAVTALDMDVIVTSDEKGASLISGGEPMALIQDTRFKPGDTVQTSNEQVALVRFDQRGIVRLGPLSSFVFRSQDEQGYVFELKQGKAWMNNLSTSSHVNILAGGALLVPRRASLDVAYDGSTTEVRVFSSQVTVGLVTSDYAADSIVLFNSDQLINSFLVAEGSRAIISLSKVQNNVEILRQLLYSKLIKEFQYGLMDPTALAKDEWALKNMGADDALLAELSQQKRQEITSRGLKYSSLDSLGYDLDKAIIALSDVFTFTEEKRTDRLIQSINEHILDAEYLLAFGRNAEANQRIVLYEQLMTEGLSSRGRLFEEKALEGLRKQYAQLHYALPTDQLYEAKAILSDLLIAELNGSEELMIEKLGLIRDSMNYAYSLAETHQLEARLALQDYFTRFQEFVKMEKSQLSSVSYLLSGENQIMDNLLRQYPQFYQDSFFAMKSFLEDEWLKLLPEGNEKNEERQTIISTKIDFLKQLQSFFLDEKVVLGDARQVAFRLINEIQALQTGADIGVSNLFALRLKDYGNFLKFLNTTNVSQLRGSSPELEYDKFLALQKEQVTIEQVIQEFLGEEVTQPTVSSEDILKTVSEDFEAIGVTDLQAETFVGATQATINLSGQLDGVNFSGTYDWSRKLISDVRKEGTLVSQNAIRLSSLVLLLKPKEEEVTPPTEPIEPTEPTEPEQPVSQADRVAKILLIQKLKTNGISAQEENIVVSDLDAGDFVVNGATLAANDKIQVAFAFQNKTNTASRLMIRTPVGDMTVATEYDVTQLEQVVLQVYDQAAAEAEPEA